MVSNPIATQKHKHCADHINSVPKLELQLEQVHSQHNPSGIQLGCFHRAHTLESRGAIHSQYGQPGSDRRMGKARGSVALRGSRQDSQHPHTHLREPKPPINHFGLCGQNGFGVPTLTKTRVSQPTNGCTSLCLAFLPLHVRPLGSRAHAQPRGHPNGRTKVNRFMGPVHAPELCT